MHPIASLNLPDAPNDCATRVTCASRVLGQLVYERRLALDMSLLDVSRLAAASLLDLCRLERGERQRLRVVTLQRIGEVLDLPWLHQATWDA
jgi:hypothetical protein